MHSGSVGPTGRELIVEDRDLPHVARPAHRQSSGRIEFACQNVGDRVSGLVPKKPCRQDCVRSLEQPRQGERPARGERHDNGFAKVEHRFGERALAPRQAEVDSARRLSAHRGALAKAEHDGFGAGAEINRSRYSVRAPSRYLDACDVIDAASRERRLEPLQNGHSVFRAARRRPRPQHLARRGGQRADDGDAADFGGERQDSGAVRQDHDRSPRRLSRQLAALRRPRLPALAPTRVDRDHRTGRGAPST